MSLLSRPPSVSSLHAINLPVSQSPCQLPLFPFLLPPSSSSSSPHLLCFLFNPDGLIRHRLQTPRGCLTPRRLFFYFFFFFFFLSLLFLFLSLVLKRRSVSHLSPSLISLREPALTHSCTHTLNHSLDSQTNTNTHTHTLKRSCQE